MDAVVAGWFAGYAMGLATTAALVAMLVRSRDTSAAVERWVAREVPGSLVAIMIFSGASIFWTMVGLIFGSAYHVGFRDTPSGLGSPSLSFALSVSILALFPLPPMLYFERGMWGLWVGMSVLFAALFGWGVPLVAD